MVSDRVVNKRGSGKSRRGLTALAMGHNNWNPPAHNRYNRHA